MKHEKQARALIRKMIRRAKQDWTTCIFVTPYGESDLVNEGQLERQIVDAVFSCDETTVTFNNMTTGRNLGSVMIVLEYDREPCEIVSDYTANPYTQRLIDLIGA